MAIEEKCKNCRRFGERIGYAFDAQGAYGIQLPGNVCRLVLGPDDHISESKCNVLDITGPNMHAFRPTFRAQIVNLMQSILPR